MTEYLAPDGYGRYGTLDTDDEGRLICHECGHSYAHLSTHVRQAHGIMPADYRAAHGLGVTRALVSKATTERMRAAWDRHADAHLDSLEQHRDIDRARAAVPDEHRRGAAPLRTEVAEAYRARARATRGRPNASRGRSLTATEVETLGNGTDLRVWADAARALLTDPSVSLRSLAEASGIAVPTVHQRLRRYPPQA